MQVPNILLPVQVAALVGPNGEGAALGLVNMLIQLSGFTQPFIGAWSDRSQSRWGRRRPFILFGQIGVLVSLYMMMVAEDMAMLSLGNFLFSALNNVPTTVYAAVIPELVAGKHIHTQVGNHIYQLQLNNNFAGMNANGSMKRLKFTRQHRTDV